MTRSPLAVLLSAVLIAAAGCAPAEPTPETLILNGIEITRPEFEFGLNVDPDPTVGFAPDVVIVRDGAKAARGVTGDGLTWTLDPAAPGIEDLAVGKVMFLTSRGVGRVVARQEDDAGVHVSIAPVDITEVITEGEFGGEDLAIDADQMIAYDTGEQPWSVVDRPPTETDADDATDDTTDRATDEGATSGIQLARATIPSHSGGPTPLDAEGDPVDVSRRPPPPPPSWGGAMPSVAGEFRLTPACCDGGIGTHLTYDRNGLRMVATMTLKGSQPKASWHLRISGGAVQSADMRISGAAGLAFSFEAATTTGLAGNINKQVTLPGTLSFPAVAAGVPFHFTVSQSLIVATAFSAKTGGLSAHGEWTYGGGLGFTYTRGSGFTVQTPSGLAVERSLLDSISGASVGVSGLVLAHRVELRVGIGWETFSVGPYVESVSSIGVSRGSDLGSPLVVCRGADLNLFLGAGISYRLPAVIVEIINFILRVFHAKQIAAEGELAGTRIPVVHKSAVSPDAKICREA